MLVCFANCKTPCNLQDGGCQSSLSPVTGCRCPDRPEPTRDSKLTTELPPGAWLLRSVNGGARPEGQTPEPPSERQLAASPQLWFLSHNRPGRSVAGMTDPLVR